MRTAAKIGAACFVVLFVFGLANQDKGRDFEPDLSQDARRKALAAKVERVMKDDVAMAFAIGTTLNIDSVKCGQNMLDVAADVWGAQIRSTGITELVCTGVGGTKTTKPIR
jgi:hypothetical protein